MIASNLHVVAAIARSVGASITHYPVIKNEIEELKKAVNDAVPDHDLILISGGSSKGEKDYTAFVIEELGRIIVNGMAIIPGKTTILADICEPVIACQN